MNILLATVTVTAPVLVYSHGAIVYPPSRNAVDASEKPWGGEVPTPVPFEPWCPVPSEAAAGLDARNLTGSNGQACFWFSNGCAIGCDKCDGATRGPIPTFLCKGTNANKTNCSLVPSNNNTHMQFGPKAPICSKPLSATVCAPDQRTVNTQAECGGDDDYFYYSPWRRPGSAPVIDACGTAGGRNPGQGDGGFGASYQNTTNARVGDFGSALPTAPSGVTWKAGTDVEVSWTLQANHGGGYSYRLCPADKALTEACFQSMALDFVPNSSAFRWGGKGGHTQPYKATVVNGPGQTSPEGSMWIKNPIPRTWRDEDGNWGKGSNQFQTGYGFQPLCPGDAMDQDATNRSCVGMWGPYNLEIVDRVVLPHDLSAGDYVLGFRWDCEESNQIWQSCSDITITSA